MSAGGEGGEVLAIGVSASVCKKARKVFLCFYLISLN